MAFDVNAALEAGYSRREIAEHLARKSGFNLKGALESGYGYEEVLPHLLNSGGKPSGEEKSAAPSAAAPASVPASGEAPLEMDWSTVGKKALRNAPGSFGRLLGDLAQAVASPAETGKALGRTVAGYAQKAAPGDILGTEYAPYAEAVNKHFSNRYGSMDGFKRALAEDPAGVAADLSTPLTGIGGLAKGGAAALSAVSKAQTALKASAALRKAGEIAAKAGSATDPLLAVARPLGSAARAADFTPAKIYGSALKFPSSVKDPEKLLRVGMESGFMPTAEGVSKLQGEMSGLGKKVESLIDARTALEDAGTAAKTIDPEAAALSAWERANALYKDTAAPTAALKSAEGIIDDFILNHAQGGNLSTRQAQNIKRATQRTLSEAYGEIKDGAAGAAKEANKGIAHEMRMGIEANVPEVAAVNKRLAELSKFKKPFMNATDRIARRDLFSLTGVAGMGAGSSLFGIPGLSLGALLNFAAAPTNKARIGIRANQAGKLFDAGRKAGLTNVPYYGRIANFAEEEGGLPPELLQLLDE